jgi:hypothetical protein
MPVYYDDSDEEDRVFHVFLGCDEGSKIDAEDRVEKLKKRSLCPHCLAMMRTTGRNRAPGPPTHQAVSRTGS